MVVSNVAVTPSPRPASRNREERTVVFTDIVESVAMKRQLGDTVALALFEQHDAAIRGLLSEYPGAKELGVAGDSFTLSFVNAADALVFSLRLHESLQPLGVEEGAALRVRIGIHTGPLFVDESAQSGRPIGGMVLDMCARVMSLADGGQTLLSRVAFDEARRELRHPQEITWIESIEWLSHGLYQMKGEDDPIEICEVGHPRIAPLKAPAHAEKARRISTPDGELVLGWRPAVGRDVPGTSWKLERPLGEGGFGEVWLARHTVLKERRVFKFCFRQDRVRSLKREVTLFRVLRENAGHHRHIVDVHDVYLSEPPYYVAMDFVEGNAFSEWVESCGGFEKVPIERRVEIIAQVADGLFAAHQAGVLHRDVKPGNILIAGSMEEPQAKLSDFGIGQVLSLEVLGDVTAHGLTQTLLGSSSGSGTQMYLAPEVVRGQPSTPQSDIFALGVVLFQAVVEDFSRPLTTDWEELVHDPLIRQDLRMCFASDPAKRFPSADRLAESLRALPERRVAAEARRAEVAAAERRAFRAGVVRTLVAAVAIVTLIAGLAVFAWAQADRAKKLAASEIKARGRADNLLERERVQRAESLLGEEGKTPAALAYLGRTLRANPSQGVAAERLVNTLLQRPMAWPLTPPLPHDSAIEDLALTPDGKSLVVITPSSSKLWDVTTGREKAAVLPVGGRRVAISPDGTHALITGTSAYFVDLATFTIDYRFEIPLRGLRDGAPDVSFRPQGDVVAVLNASDELALWDTHTGFQRGEALRPGSSLTRVLFSPDGTRLAAADASGRVWVWDYVSREMKWRAELPARVQVLAWHPKGQRLAAGASDGTIRILTAEKGESLGDEERLKASQAITDLSFSPDGGEVCVVTEEGYLRFYSGESGDYKNYRAERYKVWQVQYSSDGTMLVERTSEGMVKFFDPVKRRPMMEPLECDAFTRCFRLSSDGRMIAVGGEDGRAQVWRTDARKVRPTRVNHFSNVLAAGFQAGGKQVATAGDDGRVRLADLASATSEVVASLPNSVTNLESVDGCILAITNGGSLWVLKKNSDGKWVVPSRSIPAIAARFSGDGSHFAVAHAGGGAQMYSTATGQPVSPVLGKAATEPVAGRNGEDLIWLEGETRICRFNVKTGQQSDVPITSKSKVTSLSVSQDGCWLGSSSRDMAAVWCLDPGAAPPLYLPQGNVVTSVDFSADDRWAIVTSFHRAAHIWKLPEATRKLESLMAAGELVRKGQFMPHDSRRVWTLDTQAVRYWDASLSLPLSDPLYEGDEARSVVPAPDGRRLVIVRNDKAEVLVAETPSFPTPVPNWVADWAEAAGGLALGENGVPAAVPYDARQRWREQANRMADDSIYGRAMRWWLTRADKRSASPFSEAPAEAERRLRERQYPPRDPNATADQIDLTKYYTYLLDEGGGSGDPGNALQELGAGLHQWEGLTYDVRGVIQFVGASNNLPSIPRALERVQIGRKCRALHVIGAARNVNGSAGDEAIRLVVHFADGAAEEAPMRYGVDIGDWWPYVMAAPDRLVWTGANSFSRQAGREIGLYHMRWQNPRPEKTVVSLDFVANPDTGAPFVVALTAEP